MVAKGVEVTRICASSHPASVVSLKVLAAIAGVDISFVSIDSSDDEKWVVEVSTSVKHALSGQQSPVGVSKGLTSCARVISQCIPESGLWGQLSGGSASVESWVETASTDLASIAHVLSDKRVKEPLFKTQVQGFATLVEQHLLNTHQTYLVGDGPTAADVVVSILLAEACTRLSEEKIALPQQTHRLVETMLQHSFVQSTLKGIGVTLTVPTLGALSALPAPPKPDDVSKEGEKKKAPKTKAKKEAAPKAETPKVNPVKQEAPAAAPVPAPVAPATTSAAPAPASSGDWKDNAVIQKLDELKIAHRTYGHVKCMTAEELVENVPLSNPKHSHTKNLLLNDKKHGCFLVTVKTSSQVNTKELGKALKLEGKVNLRMASGDILKSTIDVAAGCVGPLAMLNNVNSEKKVTLVLDEGLMECEKIHSHPLTNDVSTELTPADLMAYLTAIGVEPTLLPFNAASGAAPAGKAPANRPPEKKQVKGTKPAGEKKSKEKNKQDKKTSEKGQTLLALQWKKEENFANWYTDVIVLSEMISYYDISGCYILRPWSYKIWELMQDWFNIKIRALGVENSYFPLFVSQERLEKEKDHVEGFAPEVAWVTRSGDGELAKPIAVRPTSETIMYPAFSDWIKSHRDLPLKLNQWSNVVRWEFKDPTPFLRSREFLWQEGHTVHATLEDANVMVMQALELYRAVYEDLMAVPVVPGYKTEKERFAGGYQTTTVEAFIPMNGRAIQGATSHNLGQNFGKMFDISFQGEDGKSQIPWQTSWGLTTRTIGVMVMVHGDDKGLVIPPMIAPLQVVIVPIVSKRLTIEQAGPYCEEILSNLQALGLRAKLDDRGMYNPGWKYNHWEQKGVPLRIEVGPRDMENKEARVVVRYNGEKMDWSVDDQFAPKVKDLLDTIQSSMFAKAKEVRDAHVIKVTEWKNFVPVLEKNNLVLTPWCGPEHQDWEEWVKTKSREESLANLGQEGEEETTATSVAAKTLCIPFDQPELPPGTKCIASGLDAKCWVLWGRSY